MQKTWSGWFSLHFSSCITHSQSTWLKLCFKNYASLCWNSVKIIQVISLSPHWKKEMHFAVRFSGHYLRSSGRLPFSCCTWKHQAANQSLWASAEDWPWKTFQKEQINLFSLRLLTERDALLSDTVVDQWCCLTGLWGHFVGLQWTMEHRNPSFCLSTSQ